MVGELTVTVAVSSQEEEYETLLASRDDRLIYSSVAYRAFLREALSGCRQFVVEARRGSRLVGYLPAFAREGLAGVVVNSLPFYGSHGGPVTVEHPLLATEVVRGLLQTLDQECRRLGASAVTVIESPLSPLPTEIAEGFGATHFDERISQISPLPAADSKQEIESALLMKIHPKTRNLVRKALKSDFEITRTTDPEILATVAHLHAERMSEIGGIAKPLPVIHALARQLDGGRHWNVWVARKSGRIAAALLNLEYGCVIEYFLPVIEPAFRSEQPLSGIVFTAMTDAVLRGFKQWNWGGTWLTQDEVYHFKSRWNAVDRRYRYFTKIYDPAILERSREELLTQYPYFYVAPFSALRNAAA